MLLPFTSWSWGTRECHLSVEQLCESLLLRPSSRMALFVVHHSTLSVSRRSALRLSGESIGSNCVAVVERFLASGEPKTAPSTSRFIALLIETLAVSAALLFQSVVSVPFSMRLSLGAQCPVPQMNSCTSPDSHTRRPAQASAKRDTRHRSIGMAEALRRTPNGGTSPGSIVISRTDR